MLMLEASAGAPCALKEARRVALVAAVRTATTDIRGRQELALRERAGARPRVQTLQTSQAQGEVDRGQGVLGVNSADSRLSPSHCELTEADGEDGGAIRRHCDRRRPRRTDGSGAARPRRPQD